MTVVIFWGVEQNTADKIASMNQITLTNMRKTVDNVLDMTRSAMIRVEISSEVGSALRMGDTLSADDHYAMKELVEKLREYRDSVDFIEDILVYLTPSDYYITSQTTYIQPIAGDMLKREQQLTLADMDYLQEIATRGFYILPHTEAGMVGERIVYAAPLYEPVTRERRGLLVATLQYQLFESLSSTTDIGRGVFLSNHESAIALYPVPDWLPEGYEEALRLDDALIWQHQGQKLLVSSMPSDAIDGTFIILDSYDGLFSEMQTIRFWAFVAVGISALLGIAMSLFFLDRNYSPLRQLLSKITGSMGLQQQGDTNEYHFLSEAIHTAILTKQQAENQLSTNEQALQKVYLLDLLHGRQTKAQVHSMLSGKTTVALYLIEDTHTFFGPETILDKDKQEMLDFLIENCSMDVFDGFASFQLMDMDRYIVQVLHFEPGIREDAYEGALARLEQLHSFFNESLQIKLSIALGEVCDDPRQLHQAYLKAQEAMEYRMVLGDNVVIDSTDMTRLSLFYDYSMELEHAIIVSLKNGQYQQTMDLIGQVIDENLSSGMISARLARCIFFDLTGTVVKALSTTRLDNSFLVRLDPIDRLLKCETLPQMKAELADIIRRVCDYIALEKPDDRLFLLVRQHLEKAYMDPNLSVSTLAEHFSISTTSLAKAFRENAEMTPLDYINRLRIERSLPMLMSTGMTIEAIAGKIGFGSVHTYIRVFKKIYGMTPGAYRDAYTDSMDAAAPDAERNGDENLSE